jgi:hypothetical protein
MSTSIVEGWVALALFALGCATSSEPLSVGNALLQSKQTIVESIDDRDVRAEGNPSEARFELPSGIHRVEVGLPVASAATSRPTSRDRTITVCFRARRYGSYVTRAIFEADRWRPEIVDVFAGEVVSRPCDGTLDANATNDPESAVPRAERPSRATSLPAPPRSTLRGPKLPGTGITGGVGFFFGGDTLALVTFDNGQDRVLKAGRGVLVTAGGMWTPLWIDDQFGFGAAASAGWKWDAIEASNGDVTLIRFPVAVSVHSLIRFDKRWFTLLSGGLTKEFGGNIAGSGFAGTGSHTFTNTLGLLGEGAVYCDITYVTLGLAVRYSSSKDQFGNVEVDATSLGFIAATQYTF